MFTNISDNSPLRAEGEQRANPSERTMRVSTDDIEKRTLRLLKDTRLPDVQRRPCAGRSVSTLRSRVLEMHVRGLLVVNFGRHEVTLWPTKSATIGPRALFPDSPDTTRETAARRARSPERRRLLGDRREKKTMTSHGLLSKHGAGQHDARVGRSTRQVSAAIVAGASNLNESPMLPALDIETFAAP